MVDLILSKITSNRLCKTVVRSLAPFTTAAVFSAQ